MRIPERLAAVLAAAALAAAVLIAGSTIVLLRAALKERFVDRLRAETALLAEWVEASPAADPQQLATVAAARLGARVSLIDSDGVVRGDSAVDAAGLAALANHADRAEIEAARLRGTGESEHRSATTNVEYLYSARNLGEAARIRYVRIAVPTRDVYRTPAGYGWLVLLLLAGALGLLIVPGYIAVRGLSRPLERIADEVDGVAGTDTRLSLAGHGSPELGRLAGAISRMQAALLERIHGLDAERAVFASVIAGMREGLLVVGADRRVRLVNEALRRTLELEFDPRGHLLEEAVRHPAVLEDVGAVLAEGREIGGTVIRLPGTGRSFQLQVTPLPGKGALALLFDITKLERLEAVRREFVANVSHELRTPLTSIAASVETLLDGAAEHPEDAKRFLEIIRKHSQRMGDLIEDLTDLSLIETGAVSLDVRELDATELVSAVVEHLGPLAAARRVRIRVEMPSPFPICADRRRLEQVLTNLLDNAIKFNREGGAVTVRAGRRGERAVLTVEDTGVGIPADSLDKVFHRFHQVQRDRSKDVRGTGLGLAIVKHLMRLHGGTVSVSSELGAGSRFTLEFAR